MRFSIANDEINHFSFFFSVLHVSFLQKYLNLSADDHFCSKFPDLLLPGAFFVAVPAVDASREVRREFEPFSNEASHCNGRFETFRGEFEFLRHF